MVSGPENHDRCNIWDLMGAWTLEDYIFCSSPQALHTTLQRSLRQVTLKKAAEHTGYILSPKAPSISTIPTLAPKYINRTYFELFGASGQVASLEFFLRAQGLTSKCAAVGHWPYQLCGVLAALRDGTARRSLDGRVRSIAAG